MIRILIMCTVGIVCSWLLFAAMVMGQPTPATDPGTALIGIIQSFQAGKIFLALNGIIMVLTWLLNVGLKNILPIPTKAQPWIAAGLGVASGIVAMLAAGVPWWEAIISGFSIGAGAGGLWSLIGKHALTSKKTKAARAEARTKAGG